MNVLWATHRPTVQQRNLDQRQTGDQGTGAAPSMCASKLERPTPRRLPKAFGSTAPDRAGGARAPRGADRAGRPEALRRGGFGGAFGMAWPPNQRRVAGLKAVGWGRRGWEARLWRVGVGSLLRRW